MLHTLRSSPMYTDIESMIRLIKHGDDILLLQDGVLGSLSSCRAHEILISSPASLWVLKEDVLARGLFSYVSFKVKLIDYKGFVLLTAKHKQQISW